MPLPTEVVVALIGLGAGGGGGGVIGHILTRHSRAAQVELTEAQTADIETQVYERVIKRLQAEQELLVGRVRELESEVRILREQLTRNEQRERELLNELTMVRAERDSLRTRLAAAQAEAAAHKGEADRLRSLTEHAQDRLGATATGPAT